jgi:uncharacterized integral membrane protein
MWFLKAFLVIAILAGLLYVALLNSGQHVNIYLTNPNIPTIANVELPVALLGGFILGVLVWFVASFFQVLSAKSEVAALKRKARQLGRELTDLRNMPVKDLDPDTLPPGPGDEDERDR